VREHKDQEKCQAHAHSDKIGFRWHVAANADGAEEPEGGWGAQHAT
jgi:hypothetical protein